MAGSAKSIQKSTGTKAGLLNMWVAIGWLNSLPNAVNPNAIKAALSLPLRRRQVLSGGAARPLARVWPVMLVGVPF